MGKNKKTVSLKRSREADPIFSMVGFALIFLGVLLVLSVGGYILYEIIWQGKNLPSIMEIIELLAGVLIIILGAFFLSLVYTDSEEEKRMAQKIMFPDG